MFCDDAKSQLPQLCFAEQSGVGLDGKQQAVFTQERARERVVGAHRCRIVSRVQATGNDACARQPRKPGANPSQQLAGGLTGERQAEHLTWRRVTVGYQPHDPGRHRLRLTRARARDHHQRTGWCGDDRRLFVGRREKP